MSPQSSDPHPDAHSAIVHSASQHLVDALGKAARLDVRRINDVGRYAFLYSTILANDGELIDYSDTPFAESAANHAKSATYAALMCREGSHWSVVESAIGPTDMVWQGWAAKHGLPSSLFELPAA